VINEIVKTARTLYEQWIKNSTLIKNPIFGELYADIADFMSAHSKPTIRR